jgi:hypothetical protein
MPSKQSRSYIFKSILALICNANKNVPKHYWFQCHFESRKHLHRYVGTYSVPNRNNFVIYLFQVVCFQVLCGSSYYCQKNFAQTVARIAQNCDQNIGLCLEPTAYGA